MEHQLTCNKCAKQFKLTGDYMRHINKKYDCTQKYKYKEQQTCVHCLKTFFNKYTLTAHIEICKMNIVNVRKTEKKYKNKVLIDRRLLDKFQQYEAQMKALPQNQGIINLPQAQVQNQAQNQPQN